MLEDRLAGLVRVLDELLEHLVALAVGEVGEQRHRAQDPPRELGFHQLLQRAEHLGEDRARQLREDAVVDAVDVDGARGVLEQCALTKVLAAVERHQHRRRRLGPALDLPLQDDVEGVAERALREHPRLRRDVHHLERVDELRELILVEGG